MAVSAPNTLEECAALALLVLTADFYGYYQRYRVLRNLQKQIIFSLEGFPEAKGLLEEEYQELIAALYRDKIRLVSQADNERSDLVDYYTLWAHQIKTPIAAMGHLLQSSSPSAEDEQSAAQSILQSQTVRRFGFVFFLINLREIKALHKKTQGKKSTLRE